jgi:hypothetical protein
MAASEKENFVQFEKRFYWLHGALYFIPAIILLVLPSSTFENEVVGQVNQYAQSWWPKLKSDATAIAYYDAVRSTKYVLVNLVSVIIFPLICGTFIWITMTRTSFARSDERYMRLYYLPLLALFLLFLIYMFLFDISMATSSTSVARKWFRSAMCIPWVSIGFAGISTGIVRMIGALRSHLYGS